MNSHSELIDAEIEQAERKAAELRKQKQQIEAEAQRKLQQLAMKTEQAQAIEEYNQRWKQYQETAALAHAEAFTVLRERRARFLQSADDVQRQLQGLCAEWHAYEQTLVTQLILASSDAAKALVTNPTKQATRADVLATVPADLSLKREDANQARWLVKVVENESKIKFNTPMNDPWTPAYYVDEWLKRVKVG